jgi:hypothetical protein
MERELTGGSGGVDSLGVADKINSQRAELIQTFDQLFQGPSEPVKLPNQDHIKLALASIFHQGVKLRPMTLGSADANIDVFAVMVKTLGGLSPKVQQLYIAILVKSADPSVKGGGLNSSTPAMLRFSRWIGRDRSCGSGSLSSWPLLSGFDSTKPSNKLRFGLFSSMPSSPLDFFGENARGRRAGQLHLAATK